MAVKALAKKLTAKQEMFIQEFIIDMNGSAAAIRSGYSENSARQIATEMLSKPYIQEAVAKAQHKRNERVQITQADVLERLIRLADAAEQDDEKGNALRAVELLGKTMAMFTDKQETTGKNGGPIELDTKVTVEFINATPKKG